MNDKKTLLLRFAELEVRTVRREVTEAEIAESEELLKELALTREQALEEAKTIVVINYEKSN